MSALVPVLAALAMQVGSGGDTHLVVVSGAGGEPAYREAFHEMGARLVQAATGRLGLADSRVVFLAEDATRPPATGRSTRAALEQAIGEVASRAAANDRVAIVLIGHGSYQGGTSRFNLPGPDIGATEFATLLGRLGDRTVAIINAASASGEWVASLAGPNRIVITATKSGMEGNATIFPRHFVEALAGDGADADKDGAVSLLEAYDYARRETAREYERENRLLTEHAQLEDDGDGRATAEPTGRAGDGALARRFVLRGSTVATSAHPRLARLEAQRDSLQQAIESLRGRKNAMAAAAYERELERLLLELAETTRRLREGTP